RKNRTRRARVRSYASRGVGPSLERSASSRCHELVSSPCVSDVRSNSGGIDNTYLNRGRRSYPYSCASCLRCERRVQKIFVILLPLRHFTPRPHDSVSVAPPLPSRVLAKTNPNSHYPELLARGENAVMAVRQRRSRRCRLR